jgi:hypothetical protein
MPRVAFFKNTTVVDADQNAALAGILTRVGAAEASLATKAEATALAALDAAKADQQFVASALAAKADSAALAPLAVEASVATRLAAKASQDAVDALAGRVTTAEGDIAARALQSAVDSALATKAAASELSALDDRVAMTESGKLNVVVHDARVAAENAFFTAFHDGIHLAASSEEGAPEFDYSALVPSAPQ